MRRLHIVAAILLPLLPSLAAAADCTAPAAPGVDWQRCYMDERDLAGVNLSGSRLRETSFQRTTLVQANLSGVDAYRARFLSSAMRSARLDKGEFSEADFTKADMAGVSMRDTDLRRAKFFRAVLRGADLTGAKTMGADFLNADLSGARWTDGQRLCAEGSIGQCN
jgi:uncharacterized protein YjbI with pentapeptide repeats